LGVTATREQVNDFLKRFKAKVDEQGSLPLIPRRENLNALTMLGIARSEVKTVVFGLTDNDYESGPEADRDQTAGELWIFGVDYEGTEVYIKLKLSTESAKCLSFHQAGRQMTLPYRGGR
jgi:hypothetical protein